MGEEVQSDPQPTDLIASPMFQLALVILERITLKVALCKNAAKDEIATRKTGENSTGFVMSVIGDL